MVGYITKQGATMKFIMRENFISPRSLIFTMFRGEHVMLIFSRPPHFPPEIKMVNNNDKRNNRTRQNME